MDTLPPQILYCPPDQTATYELRQQGVSIIWSEPHATDASGIVNLISRSYQPGERFSEGTTAVRYVFADASGNEAECTFDVTATVGEVSLSNRLNFSVTNYLSHHFQPPLLNEIMRGNNTCYITRSSFQMIP